MHSERLSLHMHILRATARGTKNPQHFSEARKPHRRAALPHAGTGVCVYENQDAAAVNRASNGPRRWLTVTSTKMLLTCFTGFRPSNPPVTFPFR